MATYIKTLKEDNGDITYPQTKAGAVYTDGGSDVQTELDDCTRFEEVSATSPLTPLVTSGMIDWTTMPPKISTVNVTITSQSVTSWSTTKQINKIEWGNGIVEYCCGGLNTGFAVAAANNYNIRLTWPQPFIGGVLGSSCNLFFSGDTSASTTYAALNYDVADIWVHKTSTASETALLNLRIIGRLTAS